MLTEPEKALSLKSRWAIFSMAAVLVIAPIAAGSSAKAANPSFIQIDMPGATATIANDINNAGQIVGSSFGGTGEHGFLYINGNFTQIDMPGANGTYVNGINNVEQIVGQFGITDIHSFLYTGGNFTQIDVPGATFTVANDINDAGQIVGQFLDSTGTHGFLYTDGSFTQIDVPDAFYTYANSINNAGQIVGEFNGFSPSGDHHGFLYTGGNFTKIDVPGATFTAANGINDAGQIVGQFLDSTNNHGFLYTGGSFTKIDVPAGSYTYANGINDAEQIVGQFHSYPSSHGFLATAIGDPHLTTYDSIHYDYQGIGDFILTRSTVDQFEVQVRTRPPHKGASATIMSQAAATLDDHIVIFDIDRIGGSFVSLDGSPVSLGIGSPFLTSDGSRISAISSKHYRVAWNGGEILDVIDKGKYLDITSSLSLIDFRGPIEGLLSSELDPDRWRVTGAASLLNPVSTPVPEPDSFILLSIGIGFTMLCIMRRRAILSRSL